MGIMVMVEAMAKPDRVKDLQKMLAMGLPATRAADGCRGLEAYLQDDGVTVVAVEQWESKSQYDEYLAWRAQSGAVGGLEELLQAPMSIRFFEAMEV